MCVTVVIIKFKSIIKGKKKKHDKIASLATTKLNSVEISYLKTSISSNISHDDFF